MHAATQYTDLYVTTRTPMQALYKHAQSVLFPTFQKPRRQRLKVSDIRKALDRHNKALLPEYSMRRNHKDASGRFYLDVHALGSAVNKAFALANQLCQRNLGAVQVEYFRTDSVPLLDDVETNDAGVVNNKSVVADDGSAIAAKSSETETTVARWQTAVHIRLVAAPIGEPSGNRREESKCQ